MPQWQVAPCVALSSLMQIRQLVVHNPAFPYFTLLHPGDIQSALQELEAALECKFVAAEALTGLNQIYQVHGVRSFMMYTVEWLVHRWCLAIEMPLHYGCRLWPILLTVHHMAVGHAQHVT